MKIRYLTFSTSWVELSAGSLHTVPLDQVLIVEVGIQFVFSLIFFTDWPSWSCHRRSSLFRWSIDEAAKKDNILWETFVDFGIYIYIWKQWQVYKGDIMLHEKISRLTLSSSIVGIICAIKSVRLVLRHLVRFLYSASAVGVLSMASTSSIRVAKSDISIVSSMNWVSMVT